MKEHSVYLTDEELLLLDGRCSEKIQVEIDKVKKQKEIPLLPVLAKALVEAMRKGELNWSYTTGVSHCNECGAMYDYATYKSNSRYHRKGEKNKSKPQYLSGMRYNPGFVRVIGVADMCSACFNKLNPQLLQYIVDNDLQVQLPRTSEPPTRWFKDPVQICFKCGKDMYKSEMKRLPTLMGDGTYAGGCPHCGAESLVFGSSHESTDRFRMVRVTGVEECQSKTKSRK